jgi:hypothetical protein
MRIDFYETKDAASAQFCCFDCGASYVLTADQQQWSTRRAIRFRNGAKSVALPNAGATRVERRTLRTCIKPRWHPLTDFM